MDEVCVHCGRPVHVVRTPWGGAALVHRASGADSCLDGSGRMACLPQGGVE
ncbi:hypothetical protein SEA_AMYMECH_65 [Mycobacterium phage Amymech]|nr:hypothetical protein PBI_HH92_64 [Mycobacterium phage HH92]ALA06709.1 hypothetical protein SEA_OBUpride_65 [Mycobacterium phage OBUpride]QDH48805.1 hypothetical protein SEA_DEEPSOIL15_65 [Mycobacterium phage DeepSoil15]QIQ62684.1 hypothetical protein SEA_EIN37_65 [Mycobacterium phage Ein37]QNL29833.1 hypothetical protein SEA_WEBSTER2_65 [Mycobacterium phage Webster2]QOC58823.1 hypothetical protein PBI_LUKE_64 [Mycobacterium phage Luke]UXE03494.1 hypothetical protein SEA_AMYMECH_65 [Mycobac